MDAKFNKIRTIVIRLVKVALLIMTIAIAYIAYNMVKKLADTTVDAVLTGEQAAISIGKMADRADERVKQAEAEAAISKVKGFYIGMDIDEAVKLLNEKHKNGLSNFFSVNSLII